MTTPMPALSAVLYRDQDGTFFLKYEGDQQIYDVAMRNSPLAKAIDNYTHAAIEAATLAAQRQPLTDEELDLMSEKALFCRISRQQFARSIEAAHGITATPQGGAL